MADPTKGNGAAFGIQAAKRKAAINTKAVFAPATLPGTPSKGQGASQNTKNIQAREEAEALPEGLIRKNNANLFGH